MKTMHLFRSMRENRKNWNSERKLIYIIIIIKYYLLCPRIFFLFCRVRHPCPCRVRHSCLCSGYIAGKEGEGRGREGKGKKRKKKNRQVTPQSMSMWFRILFVSSNNSHDGFTMTITNAWVYTIEWENYHKRSFGRKSY